MNVDGRVERPRGVPCADAPRRRSLFDDIPADDVAPSVTRVQKHVGWRGLGLRDLWVSRELLWFLALRDIKVRYKQTFFGAAWAIGQPLATMAVFTLIFGRLAKLPSEGAPYSVFVLAGLVPWGLVTGNLPGAAASLVSNVGLITKVRIHNMLVPAAVVMAGIADVLVASVLVVAVAAGHGIYPAPRLALLPVFIAIEVVVVLGVSLLLSSVTVLYRDIRYVVPFAVQLWLFLTPVVYPSSEVQGAVRWLFLMNPMVFAIEGFRWAVLGTHAPFGAVAPIGAAAAVVALVLGCYVFRRLEPTFADAV